jgi:hypothetical protein
MYDSASQVMPVIWIIDVVFYVVWAVSLFFIAEKANVKNRWVAFIPVVQLVVMLHIIDKSGWAIFLLLVPVLNIILSIIWMVKFFLAFKVNVGLIVLSIIIPIVNLVMVLIIAFSDQFKYVGSSRFTES